MTGRRTIIGLCMLCALLVSAFAAQGASAITGTTTFTCVKGQGSLRGEHCLTSGSATAEYGHVKISQDRTTEVSATNAKTDTETASARIGRLKVTIAGVPLELSATGISGSGSIENKLSVGGEHYTHTKGTLTFTGVEVTLPSGRGCNVTTHLEPNGTEGDVGVVHTRELTATTEGQGDFVKLQPAEGEVFANFMVTCEEGKKIPAIEKTWSCSGSVKGVPSGSTIELTHTATTEQNTLKCKGTKTGIDGSVTRSGREKGSSDAFKPLVETTVTTGETGTPGVFTGGTTASTCVKGQGTLRGEHCSVAGGAAAEYGHVAVAENTTTEMAGTNAKTANETITRSTGRLKTTVAGVPLELTATSVEGSGWLENEKTASDEHYTHMKGTITFTEVIVASPEGRGCKVYTDIEAAKAEGEAGVVHSRELTATTDGQGEFLKFEPTDGPTKSFANFFLTCEAGKKIEAIEGTWECIGTVKGVPTGPTTEFAHAETTTQNTLKCKGTKTGIEGGFTLSGREDGSAGSYTPLAQTSITT